MDRHLRTLAVAVILTFAIALISGGRWPHYVVGAAFASTLWVILLFSTWGQQGGSTARVVAWPVGRGSQDRAESPGSG